MKITEEQRIKQREACRKYYENNKEARKAYFKINSKKHYLKNKEKTIARTSKYKKENRGKMNLQAKENYHKNKEIILSRKKRENKLRYRENINFNIACKLRTRITKTLKGKNKSQSTLKLLGCTVEEFKKYIEKQFVERMNWENNTLYGWRIDHIKPCASFDLSDAKQQEECFHYTNLRPLWAKDNLARNRKW